MTTYIGTVDLNSCLENFVDRYYGTFLDDGEDLTISDSFYEDMRLSYEKVNEILSGIAHIKTVPVGTQADGRYPFHIRNLQSNIMIYQRLLGKHHGEVRDEIPGWIRVYYSRANETIGDIRGQNVVFTDDITYGEAGIGVGTWATKAGQANLYTNWEQGFYTWDGWTKNYVIQIDGTTAGNVIGSSTFKWSSDGGFSWEKTEQSTGTAWIEVEYGLQIRWEPYPSGTLQTSYGDRYEVRCTPVNVPQKSGNVRYVTFGRG